MILAGNAGVAVNAIREIFGLLDKAVYWVLVHVVNLLTDIARTNVLTESTIQTFANRIYFIMGTIMFFKMAVSIITYIVDPDKLTDSKTGFASIIKNTVIALVMVVAVPIVFRYAMFAQEAILQDDTIGRLITGKTGGTQNNVGDTVATNILSGFIHPDEDIVGGECNNLGYSEECRAKLATYSADLALTYSYINPTVRSSSGVPGSPYGYAHLIDLGTANDVHKAGGAKNYVIDYKIALSTLAGGFAVYIFLLSCFDVAVRTVKFAFLQIIAPIPIATYIDEKGKTMFTNWRKACVSTYVDLFVRLAAVQFGIFMITEFVGDLTNHGICSTQIQNGQIITGACRRPGIFVELFIIFGILLFIKEVPKLVEQITGIKLDGKFTMGFRNRLGEVPLIGGAAAAGLTTAGNAALAAPGAVLGRVFKNTRFGDNMMLRASRRWNRGLEEGHARMQASGWAGGQFKGDTVHSMRAKEREEMIKKRREASIAVSQQRAAYSMGKASGTIPDVDAYLDSAGNWTNQDGYKDEYVAAGFKSDQYIDSAMTVDQNKFKLIKASEALEAAQIAAQEAAMGVKGAKSKSDAARDLAAAREAYEKAQKALSSSEENLKLVGERHAGDAKLAQARKVAKGEKTEANDHYTGSDRRAY